MVFFYLRIGLFLAVMSLLLLPCGTFGMYRLLNLADCIARMEVVDLMELIQFTYSSLSCLHIHLIFLLQYRSRNLLLQFSSKHLYFCAFRDSFLDCKYVSSVAFQVILLLNSFCNCWKIDKLEQLLQNFYLFCCIFYHT